MGFDITQSLTATARYAFGLNNRLKGGVNFLDGFGDIIIEDISTKFNFFQIGIGYKF